MALIQDVPPYQTVESIDITPGNHQLISDEHGNQYAEFDLAGLSPGTSIPIEIRYRVAVNEVSYDLTDCEGEVPVTFTDPELHIESNNPQITDLAGELSKGQRTACDEVRAFYDHIGNRLVYSYNGANWGAQAALGPMGADCTEYASLMMALSRASGIPARYLEGIRILNEGTEPDAQIAHAWLEVYLPGIGWTSMDPTLGRSSLSRETYFAHVPPDRVIVSVGRNPSTLRGASYYSHLYWPGSATEIRLDGFEWVVTPVE
jgi:transglutaminase-like putative cysteine protease